MKAKTSVRASVDSSIIGFVEILDESGVYGWAYDTERVTEPATLLFHIDDTFVAEIVCEAERTDVLAAGHPRSAVGFHATIPHVYFDDSDHTYHFTTAGHAPVSLVRDGAPARAPKIFRFSTYFDAEFYRRFYPDARGLADLAAFDHWSRADHHVPRHGSPAALFASLAAAGSVLPEDFSPLLYRFLNPSIAGATELDWQAQAHYLMFGKPDGKLYSFTGNSFLVDAYFNGVAPSAAEMDAFLLNNRHTLYTSLDDLFLRGGITSDTCLRYLNVSDYVADNLEAGLKTKMACLRHFVESGLRAGRALSFEMAFDPVFVAEMEEDYESLLPAESYLEWINTGSKAGILPNATAFLKRIGLSNCADYPPAFSAEIYLDRNPDLRATLRSRWHALRHAIEQGLPDGRSGCPVTPATCDIYRAAADRLAVANRLQPARKLYEALLGEDPRHMLGNRHYADCLLRLDEPFIAALVYESTIAHGGDNIWTHLNLTTCHIKQRRWADACAAMRRISTARPGDRAVQRRYREVMRDAYTAIAGEARWLAENKFYDRALLRMQQACDLLTAPLEPTLRVPGKASRPIRSVIIIADLGLPQCKFYRIDQKVEQFKAAGVDCTVIEYHSDISRFVRDTIWTDAVIFYRVPATPDVAWSIWLLRQAGIPIFFEIDDLMFDPTYFPDSFESYGGQITHDLYATLVNGAPSLASTMSVCDYALASTPALAEIMQTRVVGQQSFVQRNSLGQLHAASYGNSSAATRRDKVRIFYGSGTRAHNEDFDEQLAEPLARLLKQWGPSLELLIMGYLTLPACLRPYQGQIAMHAPIWDLRTYWNVLREVDISVAVLKPGLIADCKSEIKWLEAAMLGVPSVVTATRTYADAIEDGRTGVLIKDAKDWFGRLDRLVRDAQRRREIGSAARTTVLQHYSVTAMAANVQQILDAVTTPSSPARKRVLVVHVFYPPQSVGGATRVVADNVRDIQARYGDDYELQVFTTLEGGADAYVPLVTMVGDVRVTAISTPNEPDIDRKVWDARMRDVFDRVVEHFKPDLVHLHCIQRITVSVCESLRRQGIPYVVTVHDGWWISESQFLIDEYGDVTTYNFADPLSEFHVGDANRLERMTLKQEYLAAAERVIAVSPSFAALYRRCGFSNVIAIENGVSPLQPLPRRPSADGRVRLAHIGGASFHKGYHLVRTALCRGAFDRLALLVIDHAMDPGTERRALWGATEVTLRGKTSQSKVAELYAEVDVLLAPSIWPESYGLVAREATLSGSWVVASDRGAIGTDVTPDRGFVIDVGSFDGITAVFTEMNRNPAKYLQPVQPAVLRTAAQQADELVALYRALLADGKPEIVSPKPKRRAMRAA